MSDDPDFPKANHALQVLRQAHLSRNEAAAIIASTLMSQLSQKQISSSKSSMSALPSTAGTLEGR